MRRLSAHAGFLNINLVSPLRGAVSRPPFGWCPFFRRTLTWNNRGVAPDGNFDGAKRQGGTATNFRDSAQDARVKVARATVITNSNRNVFENYEVTLVPNRFTITSAQAADNGALFRAVVTNSFGSATSNDARLTVVTNSPPALLALYSANR